MPSTRSATGNGYSASNAAVVNAAAAPIGSERFSNSGRRISVDSAYMPATVGCVQSKVPANAPNTKYQLRANAISASTTSSMASVSGRNPQAV